MKRVQLMRLGILLATGVLATGPVSAQTTPPVSIFVTPRSDVTAQEGQYLVQQLLLAGGTIEAALISAVSSGPPAADIAAIQTRAVADFTAMQAWLSANGLRSGFDAPTLSAIAAQTPEQLALNKAQLYAAQYQSTALTALARIAGPTGQAFLQNIAGNANSPLQTAAQNALNGSLSSFKASLAITGSGALGFVLQGTFATASSSAINLATQPVVIRVGTFVAPIPAGSFVVDTNGKYTYTGQLTGIDGTIATGEIDIKPQSKGSFVLHANEAGVNLSALATPIEIGLMVGGVGGTTLSN